MAEPAFVVPRATMCEVENCNRMIAMQLKVRDGLVGLCEYHTRQVDEMFPSAGIIRYPGKSVVDWHDRMYHEGVPEHIIKSRTIPEPNRKWY